MRVNLGDRSYNIAVTSAGLEPLGAFAREHSRGTSTLVVTDDHLIALAEEALASLRGSGFRGETAVIPAGEASKSLATASTLYDRLVAMNADRATLIAAVGGGVVGDLAGLVAATYARGLPLLMVPTTLLAMVDSSVGGKVAVNHPKAKNLIGAFHQPIGVWIDTGTLATLPEREFRSGLAEVVKYGVSLDADLFTFLEANVDPLLCRDPDALRHVIVRSCELKASIVERDEREETGLRAVLNYGHTFAHAFETVAGYGAWLHGEAVAAGMACAARLAAMRGLIAHDVCKRQDRLLARFGLPAWGKLIACPTIGDLLAAMRSDKKSVAGRLRFVLPTRLGETLLFDDIPESDVEKVLDERRAAAT
jgi:3-dehydroquinate synthase